MRDGVIRCAYCRGEIKEEYYTFQDNFLQLKYFEWNHENIFCSQDCACDSLMLKGETVRDDDEYLKSIKEEIE